ncbi:MULTISPECIES: hypothetical protein [Sinorhizobium]|uniref:hypothetical protein n=1 Tax=Sinorhizobium TaxID=28105 RepID=UPI0004B82889|nr:MULTISPECIES: hypothetical protein [Sinorhizobium]ASY58334.1 hypothetical protein SS05631_c34200 [Sinorhizobium sp. CCBAU 05631]PDT51745.1 hypothetical protein CO664_17975 [Sinorhizobium sp. NG07B]POH27069.1 hypothetical protein ATY30_22505 [Sinorhizobium americanum]
MAKDENRSKGVPDVTSDSAQPVKTDSDLHPEAGDQPLEPDELVRKSAAREAMHSKRDGYVVESDLEDEDQRFPLPTMKDQD